MNTDQPIRPGPTTKDDAAFMGALMGFITGALIGSGVPEILGAPQDVVGIFGSAFALSVGWAVVWRASINRRRNIS